MEEVVLLADPSSRAWGFAENIKEYIGQEKRKSVPLEPVEIDAFSNKEIDMHIPKNMRGRDIYFIQDSTKNPQQWWCELLLVNNLLHLASVESVSLVLPEIKFSKQDKKKRSRVPISSVAVAESLKHFPRLKRVITMDLHSKQIQGFYSPIPLDDLSSTPTVIKFLRGKSGIPDLEDLVIVGTDKGDFDRVVDYAERIGSRYDVAMIYKIRNLEGDREIKKGKTILVGDVKGKRAFSPDDIIGAGNTSCTAGTSMRENGATEVYLYGTHGWFTNGTKDVLDVFDGVMISNTNNQQRRGIKTIDVSTVFAEAIYRAQVGESISELYENHPD